VVAVDGEVHRGDVVLHGPDERAGGSELVEEVAGTSGREGAMGVPRVAAVQASQRHQVSAINRAAVAVDEFA
jgi:hypothetical protein